MIIYIYRERERERESFNPLRNYKVVMIDHVTCLLFY